jgi:hypothetical protein
MGLRLSARPRPSGTKDFSEQDTRLRGNERNVDQPENGIRFSLDQYGLQAVGALSRFRRAGAKRRERPARASACNSLNESAWDRDSSRACFSYNFFMPRPVRTHGFYMDFLSFLAAAPRPDTVA